jgi:hypothetical protein
VVRPKEGIEVADEKRPSRVHPSRGAEGAAVRWGERHPDEDVDHPAPPAVPEDEDIVPNRHSASAEAAAMNWRQKHDED